jgi:hypothetical protein
LSETAALTASRLPLQNEIRDSAQQLGWPLNSFEGSASRLMRMSEVLLRGFNSIERRISGLL